MGRFLSDRIGGLSIGMIGHFHNIMISNISAVFRYSELRKPASVLADHLEVLNVLIVRSDSAKLFD